MSVGVLFVQGAGENVHDQWDDKLAASLRAELGPDYEVRYPRMPNEDEPNYAAWSAAIQAEVAELSDHGIVVGHSFGGTFLINTLAERPPARALGAIILVAAPFVGEGGWETDEWTPQRALGEKLPARVPVHLFQGLADDVVPASHAELYHAEIPRALVHPLPARDHQLNGDMREVAAVIKALAAEK